MTGTSILLVASCVLVLIILTMLITAGVLISRAGGRDTVSQAREDWIHRRSEKDEQGW